MFNQLIQYHIYNDNFDTFVWEVLHRRKWYLDCNLQKTALWASYCMRKAMWPQVWRMLLMYHCTALQSTGLSQLVENIQSRFSVKLIRTWGDSELPSLPLFKCLTLILFAIMCRCHGRIPCGISALCQVYMLFVVYQDFDKWEGSAMAGTLDYSPPVDHIEPSRSSGYY